MGETPSTVCPECEYVHTDHTSIHCDDEVPVEGAVSICWNCGFVSLFDSDLQLTRPDLDSLFKLAEDDVLMRTRDAMLIDIERRRHG